MSSPGADLDRRLAAARAALAAPVRPDGWADVERRAGVDDRRRLLRRRLLVVAVLVLAAVAVAAGTRGVFDFFGSDGVAPTPSVNRFVDAVVELQSAPLPADAQPFERQQADAQRLVPGSGRTLGTIRVPGGTLTLWSARRKAGGRACGAFGWLDQGTGRARQWYQLNNVDCGAKPTGGMSTQTAYIGNSTTVTIGWTRTKATRVEIHLRDGSTRTRPVTDGWFVFLGKPSWWGEHPDVMGITLNDAHEQRLASQTIGAIGDQPLPVRGPGSRRILRISGAQIRESQPNGAAQQLGLIINHQAIGLGATRGVGPYDQPAPPPTDIFSFSVEAFLRPAGDIIVITATKPTSVALRMRTRQLRTVVLTPVRIGAQRSAVGLLRLPPRQHVRWVSAVAADGKRQRMHRISGPGDYVAIAIER